MLLAHARKCERIELYTAYDDEASESLRTEFRELVRQRAAGVPVAYLIGHREFYSLDFHVTPDVLIPRPETEFLVIAVTDLVKQTASEAAALTLADVGTGSGILATCLARATGTGPGMGHRHQPRRGGSCATQRQHTWGGGSRTTTLRRLAGTGGQRHLV